MSFVSICIPAYNNPDYLTRAIDSILIQTFQDYEIIVTDDSPSDVLNRLIKERYSRVNNLHYIKNPTQLGATANWNFAIAQASSNLIKLLHHDDWFTDENSLQEFLNPFLLDSELDFVFCQSHHFGKRKHLETNQPALNRINRFKIEPASIISKNFIITPSATIYRKTALNYDINLTWLVDVDFYATYTKTAKIQYIPKPLISLNISKGRLTTDCEEDAALLINEVIYLLNKYRDSENAQRYILDYFRKVIRTFKLYNIRKINKKTGISSIPIAMESLLNRLTIKDKLFDAIYRIVSRISQFVMGENYKAKIRNLLNLFSRHIK